MKLRELKCVDTLNCELEHIRLWKQIKEEKLKKLLLIYLTSFYKSWTYDASIEYREIKRRKRGHVEVEYENWIDPSTSIREHSLTVKIDIEERILIQLMVKGNQRKRCLICVGKSSKFYVLKTNL